MIIERLVALKHLRFHHTKTHTINQQEELFSIQQIADSFGVIVQEVQVHGL